MEDKMSLKWLKGEENRDVSFLHYFSSFKFVFNKRSFVSGVRVCCPV